MNLLAEKVLKATTEYIGPASIRFLNRQTEKHLAGLKLEDIQTQNLPELSKWVRISAGLLIDEIKAKELSDIIMNLR